MKRLIISALALASCSPAPQAPASSAPDPMAAAYEVRVDQAVLPSVRSVRITGPDIETVEFRQGSDPNTTVLTPGRIGRIKLDIATDWAAAETTMETWRAAITAPQNTPTQTRRTVTLTITSSGQAPVTYTFQRCIPTTHVMDLGAQPSRIGQFWSVVCETAQRA